VTTTLPRTAGGGVHARRAVLRWGWRLFRREWRQQLLILGLLAVAVAATIWGAGVANNTLPSNPNYGTFGTAAALVTLPGSDPHLAADIAAIQYRWGPADVIRNQNITTGTTQSVQLRAESPHGLYSGPMLGLVSGAYPSGPGQVALTGQVATLYNAHVGGTWQAAGRTWRVTGIVQNPSNLRDEFALVAPGQVTHPSQVIMLLGSAAASHFSYSSPSPPSTTTSRTFGRRSRSSARVAANSAPTTTTCAAESSSTWASSSRDRRKLTTTLAAPMSEAASVSSRHAGWFLSSTARRSPGLRPDARSAPAARRTRSSS